MSKKLLCVILALVLVLSCVVCASGSEELFEEYLAEAEDIRACAAELKDTAEYSASRELVNQRITTLRNNITDANQKDLFTEEQKAQLDAALAAINDVFPFCAKTYTTSHNEGNGAVTEPTAHNVMPYVIAQDDGGNVEYAVSGKWTPSTKVERLTGIQVSWEDRVNGVMRFSNLPTLPSNYRWVIVPQVEEKSFTEYVQMGQTGTHVRWEGEHAEISVDVSPESNGDILWGASDNSLMNYVYLCICTTGTIEGVTSDEWIQAYFYFESPVAVNFLFSQTDNDIYSPVFNETRFYFEHETIGNIWADEGIIGYDFNYWEFLDPETSQLTQMPTTIAQLRATNPTYYNNHILDPEHETIGKNLNSLYGNWTAWPETFVFNSNGAYGTPPVNYSGAFWDTIDINPANLYITGYTWYGWDKSPDATIPAIYNTDMTWEVVDVWAAPIGDQPKVFPNVTWPVTTTKNDVINVYAIWRANEYTVFYNGRGSTGGTMQPQVMYYDTEYTLTNNGFGRDGFTFLGWSTEQAATTVTYANKATVKNLTTVDGDEIMLYAVWKPNAPVISARQGDKNISEGAWATGDVTVLFSNDGSLPNGIKSFSYSVNGGAWTSSNGTMKLTSDGVYEIKAKAVATNGMESDVSTFNLRLDETPPRVVSVVKDPSTWTREPVTLTITVADDTTLTDSGYDKMQFNNGSWTSAPTKEYVVTESGNYPLKVSDKAGNVLTTTIVVDNIDTEAPAAPTITATTSTGATVNNNGWTNNTTTLTFHSEGGNVSGVASYACSLNGGEWVSGNSITFSAPGTYAVVAKAVSPTGIESVTSENFVLNIEKTMPTYDVTRNPDGYSSSKVELTITGNDAESGYSKMQFNGEDWSTERTNTYTVTENGYYGITIEDKAGNVLTDWIYVNTIDRSAPAAPTISCVVGETPIASGQWINSGTAKLTFAAADVAPSGISGYEYSLDGGITWKSGDTVSVSDDGEYKVQAKTISGTGVKSAAAEFALCIDKTAPQYSDDGRSEIGLTANDVVVTVIARDSLSGFSRMQFNGGAWIYQESYDFIVSANGTYPIIIVDVAGNTTEGSIVVNNIERSQPATPTISATLQGSTTVIENGGWAKDDVTIKLSGAFVNQANPGSYKYSLDGGVSWTTIAGKGSTFTIEASNGWFSVMARAVSATGVESLVSTEFTFGIDQDDPAMTFGGNPTTWSQNATITVYPLDTGGSGLSDVFVYDKSGQRVSLPAPHEYNVTENGTYTFVVLDLAGNETTKTLKVDKVDADAPVFKPGYPRKVELAADKTYAVIHMTVEDEGSSGIKSIKLPSGSTTVNPTIGLKVYENKSYTFTAVDNAGNEKTEVVQVAGLTMSDDVSLTAVLYTENGADAGTLTEGDDTHTFSVSTAGIDNGELELTCKGVGGKIVSVNGTSIGMGSYSKFFSVGPESEENFTVVVMAADKSMATYNIVVSAMNKNPEVVSISNATEVRKSWFTESGYVLDHSFITYDVGREGIEIQVTAIDQNKGQYVSGYVTFKGINYPIEWDFVGSLITEYESKGTERKGYAFIPVSAYYSGTNDSDIDNEYAYVHIQDSVTPGGEVLSYSTGANDNVKIRTDVSAPVVIIKAASTRYAVRVGLADTTYVNAITVTLTPKNGSSAGVPVVTEYTHTQLESDYIYLEDGINYEISVVAVDVAGHLSNVTKVINFEGGVANITAPGGVGGGGEGGGGGEDPEGGTPSYGNLPVDFEKTFGNVYTYKTRMATYYLVGCSGDGNTDVIAHLPNFEMFHNDVN